MRKRNTGTSLLTVVVSVILISDWNTAMSGANEGIQLCLYSVIPSLFPMFVLTTILSSSIHLTNSPIGRSVCKLCKMPAGSESFLFLGLLSGYPVGAQCITEAYHNNRISKTSAHRLLGFCSNAGPAFILGMVSFLFPSKSTVFILWIIHILSTLIVGHLLPCDEQEEAIVSPPRTVTMAKAVEKSVKNIAIVCGWIILFKIFIAIIDKWFFSSTNNIITVTFSGILELANGIYRLNSIENLGMKFSITSFILGLGGVCVLLQTNSVTSELGLGYYFPGKVLQAATSFLIASVVQYTAFPKENRWESIWIIDIFILILWSSVLYFLYKQKNSSISDKTIV